ncbi:MAG: HIG1 domain-containing protein [Rhodospirillales bacterium]|nr:HIG1 domain-containing protein [Rhodospirillales bacterium]
MESAIQFIPVVIVVLMVAVVLVLFMGLGGMAFGGRITPMARNKLMRVRVYLQGIIVLLVLITFAAAALK